MKRLQQPLAVGFAHGPLNAGAGFRGGSGAADDFDGYCSLALVALDEADEIVERFRQAAEGDGAEQDRVEPGVCALAAAGDEGG